MLLPPRADKRITAKQLLPGRVAIVICSMALALSGCSASRTSKRVNLEEFREGVAIREQVRLKVKDVLVGEKNVKHLFRDVEYREPSRWEYYLRAEDNLKLVLKDSGRLEELRVALAAQQTDRLKVVLEDDRDTVLRRIWGLRSENRFRKTTEILVVITPCDEITRIIYTSINSIVKEQSRREGTTDEHVDLNHVFDKLLWDKIEPYIATLNAAKHDDPCFNTFQLLKWLKGEEVVGFDSGEYDIKAGLKGLLQPAVDALLEERSRGALFNLNVKVVGYTDPVTVRVEKIELDVARTGIDDWGDIEKPFDIRYGGCRSDRLSGERPVYVHFTNGEGIKIDRKISNNCELGAVRAYVATVYLINKLGQDGINYSYATGGVFSASGDKEKKDDPKKRKVNVELTLKTAKKE